MKKQAEEKADLNYASNAAVNQVALNKATKSTVVGIGSICASIVGWNIVLNSSSSIELWMPAVLLTLKDRLAFYGQVALVFAGLAAIPVSGFIYSVHVSQQASSSGRASLEAQQAKVGIVLNSLGLLGVAITMALCIFRARQVIFS